MITKVEADEDAPLSIEALPDYWDARRERDGKPDRSRCAAELRRVLEANRAEQVNAPRLAILESPYAGEVGANLAYARAKLGQLVRQGYSPIASHMLFTQPGVLDDAKREERALGIAAGLAWRHSVMVAKTPHGNVYTSPLTVFAAGRGWSPGMLSALVLAKREGRPYIAIDAVTATTPTIEEVTLQLGYKI